MESTRTPQSVQYTISRATRVEILEHLEACSGQFQPPLADRVDLPSYAEKLFRRSVTWEAWHREKLVGLVACYLDLETQPAKAFVSNVSVLQAYRSQGIARQLMACCHREVMQRGVQEIALEVSAGNAPAIALYSKLGYRRSATKGQNVLMQLILGTDG
ncbi:GNAT family N-acetyltransferase [Stieleria sp.]|uniref:GNAT family N-acetyltransferase n=1 Tax=Stieleria sp. TaxID=2795976 RepID=UPI0035625AB5